MIIKGNFFNINYSSLPSNLNWHKKTLFSDSIHTLGISKHEFDVFYTKYNDRIYIKPIKPYMSAEFETLFGLGLSCSGFNKNITVDITEAEIYF